MLSSSRLNLLALQGHTKENVGVAGYPTTFSRNHITNAPFIIVHSVNELHERTSRLKHSYVQRDVKAEVPEC